MSRIHIKVFFAEEIRRLQLEVPTYTTLKEALSKLFPSLSPDHFHLKYQDDEGDLVTFSSDLEFQNAVSLLKPNGILHVHLFVPSKLPTPGALASAPGSIPQEDLSVGYEPFDWKRAKNERKEQKRQLKKILKKEGNWNKPEVQHKWRCEKQEWKKIRRLAKKSPEKIAFSNRFNAIFEPSRFVAVSRQPNFPLTFNAMLKNVGSETWPMGTSLKPIGKCKNLASVPSLTMNETIHPESLVPITLSIASPPSGVHVAKWRLFLPDGKRFGPKLFVKIREVGDLEHRKWSGKRGGGCRGRGRKRRSIHPEFYQKIEADLSKLKELGYEGPHLVDLLRRFKGDIHLVINHLNRKNPNQLVQLDRTGDHMVP